MSLRTRAALAAALATIAAVVLAGVAVLAFTSREQTDQLDRELQRQVDQLRRLTVATLLEQREVPRPIERGDLSLGVRVLDGTDVLFDDDFPEIAVDATASGYATVSEDGEGYRILTTTINTPARPRVGDLTLQVSASTDGIKATLRGLRRLLFLVGLLAVSGAGIGGWILGAVAMRPLAGLRREAERVSETVDLSVRVPANQGPAEVDDLAHSLNAMLERIQEGAHQTQEALDASRGFAGNVAHELRTPLTSMQTNLEVLAANPGLPLHERNAIVTDVVDQQHRLLEALEALRLLARGDLAAGDLLEVTDLAEIVDGAVAQARARFPEATIELSIPADPPPTAVWPEGVRVLLDNLIRNAVTHGAPPDGSTPRVAVSLTSEAGEWILAVDDNGPGIPEAERAQVLQRFARGSGSRTVGSGLGLALVAQQAELHGGRVTIEDAPGFEGGRGGARIAVRAPFRGPAFGTPVQSAG
jgi:two-component system sensor histidine kinase PrrB